MELNDNQLYYQCQIKNRVGEYIDFPNLYNIFFHMNLYEQYENSKTGGDNNRIKIINDIITQYPKMIDYIYNRIDTCFGKHIVYVVHMKVDGADMIKIGYTKNSVLDRFKEKRWTDQYKIEIIQVIREYTLQAKGAVEFEKELNCQCVNYRIESNLKLPGKNEFMNFNYKDEVLKLYDTLYPDYQNIIGLKSPN